MRKRYERIHQGPIECYGFIRWKPKRSSNRSVEAKRVFSEFSVTSLVGAIQCVVSWSEMIYPIRSHSLQSHKVQISFHIKSRVSPSKLPHLHIQNRNRFWIVFTLHLKTSTPTHSETQSLFIVFTLHCTSRWPKRAMKQISSKMRFVNCVLPSMVWLMPPQLIQR